MFEKETGKSLIKMLVDNVNRIAVHDPSLKNPNPLKQHPLKHRSNNQKQQSIQKRSINQRQGTPNAEYVELKNIIDQYKYQFKEFIVKHNITEPTHETKQSLDYMQDILICQMGNLIRNFIDSNQKISNSFDNNNIEQSVLQILDKETIDQFMRDEFKSFKKNGFKSVMLIINYIITKLYQHFTEISNMKNFSFTVRKLIFIALVMHCLITINNQNAQNKKIEIILPRTGQTVDRSNHLIGGKIQVSYVSEIGHRLIGTEIEEKPKVFAYFNNNQ